MFNKKINSKKEKKTRFNFNAFFNGFTMVLVSVSAIFIGIIVGTLLIMYI